MMCTIKKIDYFSPCNAVIFYVTKMLFLSAYCLIVSLFLFWSLRTKSSLSTFEVQSSTVLCLVVFCPVFCCFHLN